MKKLVMTVAVLLVIAMSATAIAATNATDVIPTLSFSGTTANCKVIIRESGAEIEATLELWYGSTLVDSWSESATSLLVISESCRAVRGRTYTLKVSGTIDGVPFTGTPVSGKC